MSLLVDKKRAGRLQRIIAGTGIVLTIAAAWVATGSPLAGALRRGEPVAGIVLGTDLAENAPHSDTLIVWRYDPSAPRLHVLSIPRDTKIDLSGYRFRRINEVFAYHFAAGRRVDPAAREVLEAVRNTLPAGEALNPRFYFHIDFDGFRRIVDRMGGVHIEVSEPMNYDDFAGGYHFHRSTGVFWMSGDEALKFVRFRGLSGDRGRILRQIEFLRALAGRVVSPSGFWRGPAALAAGLRALDTNIAFRELPFLWLEAKRLAPSDLYPAILPGAPKGAYWQMDRERAEFVVREIVGGGPAAASGANEATPAAPAPEGPATVKVWNASGKEGLALDVARRLRGQGFDVVDWGTFASRQRKTRVVDRSGRLDRAQGVAEFLQVPAPYSDADPALRTDVEVILGEDFTRGR